MLVLKSKSGDWVEVKHRTTGDILRLKIYNINPYMGKVATIAFDDDAWNFVIERTQKSKLIHKTSTELR